ncbi:hypothetical protein [Paenibacillus caui]|uniref:hypothetical protein n=1 Tax=Paenibacillus caui TaxID=2873927 RepID=UPI001CA97464|nr:hypothetical protein [Paenibacillus caui]
MLAGLKEIKNFVTGNRENLMASGDEEYRRIEFGLERHLRTPEPAHRLTAEEEARIKHVIYH